MLEPIKYVQFRPFGNCFVKKKMDFDAHSRVREHKRILRKLSKDEQPVDFQYVVLKLLDLLKLDENHAIQPYGKNTIYKAARELEEWVNDEIPIEANQDRLEFSNFVVDDPDEEHLIARESDDEQLKSDDSDHEPQVKKRKPYSLNLTEKHHRLVRYVDKRLRRYILDDYSVEICQNSQGIVPPPARPLKISFKKTCLRSIFEAMHVSQDVYEGFYKPLTDEEPQDR